MERSNPLHGLQRSKHKDPHLVFFMRDPCSSARSLFFDWSSSKSKLTIIALSKDASTQKSSKLLGKLDHLFPTAYLYIVFMTSDGQSPLFETNSSDKGQIIEALSGQSPLYVTKSSNEGQFMMTQHGQSLLWWQSPPMQGRFLETHDGWSPLKVTKSSDEGQLMKTHSGQSPLYVTKSSNKGHDLRGDHSQWQVISYGPFMSCSTIAYLSPCSYASSIIEAWLLPPPISPSPSPREVISRDHPIRHSTWTAPA